MIVIIMCTFFVILNAGSLSGHFAEYPDSGIGFVEQGHDISEQFGLNGRSYINRFQGLNDTGQCTGVFDDSRKNLLYSHINHGQRFDVYGFIVTLVFDLGTGVKLCGVKYMEPLKHPDGFVCYQSRDSVYHGF